MRKEKDVVINLGNYRLVRFDSMNLEMEELRRPDARKARRHTEIKDDSPRWYRMGHYFRSIASGVSWLLEHRMLNEGGEHTLEESVKRYGEIADELRGYVEKATGSK